MLAPKVNVVRESAPMCAGTAPIAEAPRPATVKIAKTWP